MPSRHADKTHRTSGSIESGQVEDDSLSRRMGGGCSGRTDTVVVLLLAGMLATLFVLATRTVGNGSGPSDPPGTNPCRSPGHTRLDVSLTTSGNPFAIGAALACLELLEMQDFEECCPKLAAAMPSRRA